MDPPPVIVATTSSGAAPATEISTGLFQNNSYLFPFDIILLANMKSQEKYASTSLTYSPFTIKSMKISL